MLDNIGCVAYDAWDQKFAVGQRYVLPYAPFMFVAYVASLDNSPITTLRITPEVRDALIS